MLCPNNYRGLRDTTVQSGNIDIQKHQNVIINKNQEMDNLKDIYNEKIYKIIEYYIDESKLYSEKIIDLVYEKVTKSLTRKEKHKKYYEEIIKKNKESKSIYEKAYKNIFGEDINYEKINVVSDEEYYKAIKIYNNMY